MFQLRQVQNIKPKVIGRFDRDTTLHLRPYICTVKDRQLIFSQSIVTNSKAIKVGKKEK